MNHSIRTTTDEQRFGLKTFTNADNRDIISDFLTHLHTHRADFSTSLRHLSLLRPSSTPEQIRPFAQKMLSASIPNPTDHKIEEASRDFIPYLERYCARLSQSEEREAWEVCEVEGDRRGIKLGGDDSGWEEKREVEMLRSNPAFVLRQWVLEELISKLEETGVERIEEGRKELARVLDVRLFHPVPSFHPSLPLQMPLTLPPRPSDLMQKLTDLRCQLDRS